MQLRWKGNYKIMTTIYLIRHSKPMKVNNTFNSDSLQIQNEKSSLSIEGEQIAQNKLSKKELDNIMEECIEMIVNKIKESGEKNE